MKFCFSSMLMTSLLCQKQSRSMKNFEFWSQDQRARNAKHILGVRVEFVKSEISLSQRQYIEEFVRTFSFHKGNKVYNPVEPHSTPRKLLESEDEKFDPHLYRQLIGSLMQLATWTRPDISYSVSILSQSFSKSSSKTLDIGSKSSQLPQNYSRFRPFPELTARRAGDKLTNAQSCSKLRTAHLHWQWFCFLWKNKKKQIWSLHFLL